MRKLLFKAEKYHFVKNNSLQKTTKNDYSTAKIFQTGVILIISYKILSPSGVIDYFCIVVILIVTTIRNNIRPYELVL